MVKIASRQPLATVLGMVAVVTMAPSSPTWARPAASDLALLERSDVSRAAPDAFRAVVEVGKLGAEDTVPLEIWRRGDDLLVRFLEEAERGKFLVRRGDDVFFLGPGTRNPVRLGPRYRLGGQASLDEIVGLDYSGDFRVETAERLGEGERTQVVYELRATTEAVPYPRVRYVVLEREERPIRVEHVLASGKTAKVIEFPEWAETPRLQPRRLVIKDPIRGGAVTVAFEEVEEREMPEEIFDLEGGAAARSDLPEP